MGALTAVNREVELFQPRVVRRFSTRSVICRPLQVAAFQERAASAGRVHEINVRIISATHRDPPKAMARGERS